MKKYLTLLTMFLFAAVLMQSFQCQSRTMESAKNKVAQKDYDAAIELVNKELAAKPTNQQAMKYLAEIYYIQEQYVKSAETLIKYNDKIKDPKILKDYQRLKQVIWIQLYNKTTKFLNNFKDSRDKKNLDSSLRYIDYCTKIHDDMSTFYSQKGIIFENKGDLKGAEESYLKYYKLLKNEIDLAKKYNFFINKKRDDILKTMDKPKSTSGNRFDDQSDSIITDLFEIDGKELYLFSNEKNNVFQLKGWRYNPSKDWTKAERENPFTFDISPFLTLVQYYYDNEDFDNSEKFLNIITDLDPSNNNALRFKVSLLQAKGDNTGAKEYLLSLAEKNPDDIQTLVQIADFLVQENKPDEAITFLDKALAVDENDPVTLNFLGTLYKNKAANIQNAEQEKQIKDANYVINQDLYKPILEKSANYFETTLDQENIENIKIYVLADLVNIYEVLDNKEKMNQYLGDLETEEYLIDEDMKVEYYRRMCQIYTRLKIKDKATSFCDQLKELLQ